MLKFNEDYLKALKEDLNSLNTSYVKVQFIKHLQKNNVYTV